MKLPPATTAADRIVALLDRWLSAWIARSEARRPSVELRQRYY